ncbi:hypothetical protein MBANPS3_009545 [Mucor bainieri]
MSPAFLSLSSLAKKSPPTNRIRLAAVSNYKLAQLTFAPPDDRTLRKTALIKNLVEIAYKHTPHEHLTKHMARWEYFTPESLENMTQRDVEKIIYRTAITLGKEGSKKEQQFLYSDYPEVTAETREVDEMNAYYASLFSSTVFSRDTFYQDADAASSSSESDIDDEEDTDDDKIPESPTQLLPQPSQPKLEIMPTSQATYSSQHPKSSIDSSINEKSTSRLSWLSDTGVPTNSAVALNLASELMTLFDMEFNVDLSVPSLHGLKKLESGNGSTTSLHKVFSANEYQSSEDGTDQEEESVEEDGVGQDYQVVQAQQIDLQQLTAEKQWTQELPYNEESITKKKGFKLIPTLKQLSNRNNKCASDGSISSASSKTGPSTPTHDHYKAPLAPVHKPNYQYYYSSSSSSDSEQEEEEEEEEEKEEEEERDDDVAAHRVPYNRINHSIQSITLPNRTSSLNYRASLQDRFRLSDEDSSDASSDYFNDSVDTFQVELNCSRDSAGVDSLSFKGFLNALSTMRKTSSTSNSLKQDTADGNYPTIASTQSSMSFDSNSVTGDDDSKRKNSIQRVVKYLGGRSPSGSKTTIRRGSVASSSLSVSATSTVMSGSSIFSQSHRPQATATTPSLPTSPVTLSPRVAKRHGVYTTSIISDTSSFNWAEEAQQRDEFGSIHSKASSSKTMPAFFSGNKQQQQGLARSSSSVSLGGLLKRFTAFNKKDKKLQRA